MTGLLERFIEDVLPIGAPSWRSPAAWLFKPRGAKSNITAELRREFRRHDGLDLACGGCCRHQAPATAEADAASIGRCGWRDRRDDGRELHAEIPYKEGCHPGRWPFFFPCSGITTCCRDRQQADRASRWH